MTPYEKHFKFVLDELGDDIIINGNPARGYVEPLTITSGRYYSDRLLNTNYALRSGDVVVYNGQNYITSKQITEYQKYNSGVLHQAVWTTNLWNSSIDPDVVHSYPSYARPNDPQIKVGDVINVPKDEIVLTVPADEYTTKYPINARFIQFNSAWKVKGLDLTEQGLVHIHADFDTKAEGDDFVNNLPDGAPKPKTYSITTEPEIPSKISVGTVYSVKVNVLEDGIPMPDYSVDDISFTSNVEDVSIVYNSESKKYDIKCDRNVQGVRLVITYKQDKATLTKFVNFDDVYTLEFNGLPDSIKKTDPPADFTVDVKKNGIIVPDFNQKEISVTVDPAENANITSKPDGFSIKGTVESTVTVSASYLDAKVDKQVEITSGASGTTVEFDFDKMKDYVPFNGYTYVELKVITDGVPVENIDYQNEVKVTSSNDNYVYVQWNTSKKRWRLSGLKAGKTVTITATYKGQYKVEREFETVF